MLIDQSVLFEKEHLVPINDIDNSLYYYFDYDERYASINMEFQHLHIFHEMMLLLSPEADHLLDGKSFHLNIGDLVLLRPYSFHKSIYPKGTPSKRLIIQFMYPEDHFGKQAVFEELLNPFQSEIPIFRFPTEQKKQLYHQLNEIFLCTHQESYGNTGTDEFVIHCKFIDFLNTLKQLAPHNTYKNNSTASPTVQKMYEISYYIHNHFHEDLTLEAISREFSLSPCYLSREFKAVTQFTLTNYIQITRIKNAQLQLTRSDKKITEISQDCGFNSFSQFNRTFQRFSQMCPRDYRKHGIGNSNNAAAKRGNLPD